VSGERWDEITRWVDTEGRVALGDLASRFEVSEMTIRRDLDALTAAGRLRRVRGGAVSLSGVGEVPGSSSAPGPASGAPGGRPAPSASSDIASPASSAGPVREVRTGLDAAAPGPVPVEPPVAPEEHLPSPGFDLSRAPSSLGSVIASWAGAFPAGLTSAPTADRDETPAPAPAPEQPTPRRPAAWPRDEAREEAPPGWDVPLNPSIPARPQPAAQPAPQHPARTGSTPPHPHPADDPWLRAAHVALGELAPGSAVLLTGGTGAIALAHHVARLAGRSPATPLTVAVTALAPATVLAGAPGVRLVVLGGEAEPGGTDLAGPSALAALEDLHLDVAVLTPSGLDARGAWAPTSAAAALLTAAVARAERAVAVVASTALGRPGLVRAAPLAALAQVVAVPAAGEDGAVLTARLEALRAAAPSAPAVTAA
jgi:DeoR/GlpR family transcriptional regulator of sugar metabolism